MISKLAHRVFAAEDTLGGGGGGSGTDVVKDIVGNIINPLPPGYQAIGGITLFLSNILRLVFVAAGIYALLNFIVAGYQYMTAAGDSKALEKAWGRIWHSLLGLIIIVGSFAFAALFGYLIFGDAGYILNPKIYGPGTTGP